MAQPVRFQAMVEQVRRHTPDVASYRLRSQKPLPRFTPGQFIHLTIDDFDPAGFWPESRVFSVASGVADRRTVDLTISRQGAYTGKILDQLQEGQQVWAKGPYGEFTIGGNHDYCRAILIAGGTGITPFCAVMDVALTKGAFPIDEVLLHYGAQTPDLLIYRELADRCAAEVPGFHVSYYAEHPGNSASPRIQPGRIDLVTVMANTADTQGTAFYLSGPKPMIEAFRADLTSTYGVAPERVLVDAWE